MKTFWLSFADPDKPEGEQFLGVAVIDVSDEEAADAKERMAARFPRAHPDAEWILAASELAWEYGCNPGGAVAMRDISEQCEHGFDVPRNRLLSKAELKRLNLI